MYPIEKLIHLAAEQAAEKTLNKFLEKNSTFPEYLTTVEVAAYTGLSRQFFEIARHKGEGPSYFKIGSAVRYKRCEIDKWLMSYRRTSTMGGGNAK